ncbi:adrenodoxin precursor, putative [Trypanosoma equiperdum]|uniref:Adrenodoxin, putative n=1 Tax=Trypanosoma equiperdum TaxID=5694 RepID=A0A1G4I4N9_TRYEQ|nr:adrenodoxin precursor, putative [Trypanosoma equiperdum]
MLSATLGTLGTSCGRGFLQRQGLLTTFMGRFCHSGGGGNNQNNDSSNSGNDGSSTPGAIRVNVTTAEGEKITFSAPSGLTLMEALRDVARVDIEAACDGTCACSTCHVILREEDFGKLTAASEDEMDMLDLAPQVTPTSRLACQVKLSKELDGITLQMPSETTNEMR